MRVNKIKPAKGRNAKVAAWTPDSGRRGNDGSAPMISGTGGGGIKVWSLPKKGDTVDEEERVRAKKAERAS